MEEWYNNKYRTVASKIVNWAKMDRFAKFIYSSLIKNRFLIYEIDYSCGMGLDNCMGILALYWYFGIR